MGLDLTGLGSAFDFAGGLLDRFFPKQMTEADRADMQAKLSQAIDERDVQRDAFKRDVIVSEMGQSDKVTKWARPSIVYAGIAFIGLVHVLFPILFYCAGFFRAEMPTLPELSLPDQFWWCWTGVCSVWMIGRSAEKTVQAKGTTAKVISMITGSKGM